MIEHLHNVTDALIAALAAGTGRPVGDGVAPGPVGEDPDYPYLVVDSIAGGGPTGDAADPGSIVTVTYQVTCVAKERWKAEGLLGRVRVTVLGRDPGTGDFAHPIDGYSVNGGAMSLAATRGLRVWHREHDSSGGHLIEGPVSNVSDRYVLHVAPL